MTEIKLVLPSLPRPAVLTAFGVTMGVWVAILVGVVMPLAVLPRVAAALLGGAAIAAVFHARRREAQMLYRVWGRASRLYARIARRALLLLAHAVMTVVGLAGTPLELRRPAPDRSLWHVRQTLSTAAYGSQFDAPGPSWIGRPWRGVIDWAIRSGNTWVVLLVPLLMLLSVLDVEDRSGYPTGIYTLF